MYIDQEGHFATAKVEKRYKTRQELFNNAYRGIASQGWKRAMVNDVCMYRMSHDVRCAIGWNIPDHLYQPEFETLTVNADVGGADIAEAAGIALEDLKFANDLQLAHDGIVTTKDDDMLRQRLHYFARANGVRIPEVA